MTAQLEKRHVDLGKQRSRALRTAWVLAAVALVIFVAFVLSGVLGSGTPS